MSHLTHTPHVHEHNDTCGHTRIQHDGHTDFLHDGHMHHPHDDHIDEHVLPVSAQNPETPVRLHTPVKATRRHTPMARIAATKPCLMATTRIFS